MRLMEDVLIVVLPLAVIVLLVKARVRCDDSAEERWLSKERELDKEESANDRGPL